MLAKIIIHPDPKIREQEILKLLDQNNLKQNHPDTLYFGQEEKLGVEQVKKIREHLKLKPLQAKIKAVCLVSSQNLSLPAQNALLKSLEEPPGGALFLLGVDSETSLLPTITSRAQLIFINQANDSILETDLTHIARLENLSLAQRFKFVEETEHKEGLLENLLVYYRQKMHQDPSLSIFVQQLLEVEKWAKANVNIRGILEYIMLILPDKN